jgi:hypothetical protein
MDERVFVLVLLESFLEREIDTCVSVFASVGTVWNVVWWVLQMRDG